MWWYLGSWPQWGLNWMRTGLSFPKGQRWTQPGTGCSSLPLHVQSESWKESGLWAEAPLSSVGNHHWVCLTTDYMGTDLGIKRMPIIAGMSTAGVALKILDGSMRGEMPGYLSSWTTWSYTWKAPRKQLNKAPIGLWATDPVHRN